MLKNIYRKLEKGRATARVAPTEKRERAGQNPAPTEGYKGRGKRAVGEIGEAPPVADEASRFRGSAPIGGYDSGRQSVGTTVGNRRPLRRITRGAEERAG